MIHSRMAVTALFQRAARREKTRLIASIWVLLNRNLHRFRLSRTQIEAMSLVFSLRAARWNRAVTAIREWIILVLIVGRPNSATLRLYYIILFPQLLRCYSKPLKNY